MIRTLQVDNFFNYTKARWRKAKNLLLKGNISRSKQALTEMTQGIISLVDHGDLEYVDKCVGEITTFYEEKLPEWISSCNGKAKTSIISLLNETMIESAVKRVLVTGKYYALSIIIGLLTQAANIIFGNRKKLEKEKEEALNSELAGIVYSLRYITNEMQRHYICADFRNEIITKVYKLLNEIKDQSPPQFIQVEIDALLSNSQ